MKYAIVCVTALAAFAQSDRLSDLASRMLERTVQARAALDQRDPARARHFVYEALASITAMQIERPKAPQPFVVTLYTERVEIAVEKPQRMGANANKAPAQGDADRAADRDAVQQVEGESTRVAVDVTQAQKDLRAARSAIDTSNLSAARASLAAVDQTIHAKSEVGDLPLIKARENLALAIDDLNAPHPADAVAPLRAASAGLNEYARSQSAHTQDAAKLRSDIDSLAATVQQDPAAAHAKIVADSREISRWIRPLRPPQVNK